VETKTSYCITVINLLTARLATLPDKCQERVGRCG
jgi:hypothetical protein